MRCISHGLCGDDENACYTTLPFPPGLHQASGQMDIEGEGMRMEVQSSKMKRKLSMRCFSK
jgi:hypothetical protein